MEMFSDSRLVVGQVKGELEARDVRNRNTHIDSLATLTTSSAQSLPRVILVEDLYSLVEVKKEKV